MSPTLFIAMMPQWDFLSLLAGHGARHPTFRLRMQAEATDVIEESGRIAGVRATTPDGPLEIRATLVVAADGRDSVLREKAGLEAEDLGAPMDVLWFRLSRRSGYPDATMGRFGAGRLFVLINRGEHWQLGSVIPKGSSERIRQAGLEAFREDVARLAPFGRRPHARDPGLGRRETAQRARRSAAAVVPPGAALHR